ncbi:MAG: cardiolipin synthase [Candidatus Sumerlaeota bacterium]|nr:cardiolipin synthase [Candidatus Sumerlaeota bacterium]
MVQKHLTEIFTVIIPAIHLLGMLTAFRAIMDVRTPQGAIAWAISLCTFPYLALPLYWIFGRNKFNGYVEALRSAHEESHVRYNEALTQITQMQARLEGKVGADLHVLETLGEMPFTRGNNLELLVDGKATFDSIFAAIDEAKDYVLVQFFIIRDDELGRELKTRLIRKAREGTRIFVLFDEVGSHSLPNRYVNELKSEGVKVSPFRTTRGPNNRFQLNFRNHRKIVIVDGRVAFVGGHNVGDEYLGLDPHLGPWRDTHVRVTGPAVQCIQLVFIADWYWACRELPGIMGNCQPAQSEPVVNVLVLPTGPADDKEVCEMFFIQSIQAARNRVWIASPYFVPNAPVLAALKLAAFRGVDVRILLPQKPDHILVYLASFSFIQECEQAGVKIFRYQPGFLHQKVLLVDDEAATVGTANLDNRSLRLNFEITVIAADRGFASEIAEMLTRDFENSHRVTAEDYAKRGVFFKIAVRAARLLDPIL